MLNISDHYVLASKISREKCDDTYWGFLVFDRLLLSSCFLVSFLLYFFPLAYIPLTLPCPVQSPHCCPCPWVLFPFGSILPPPNPNPPKLSACSLYKSVSVFLVSSVCSLDSTCEWDHVVFVFLWLAYFTQHCVLQVHPCCHKGWNFLLVYNRAVFHCVNVPQLFYYLLMDTWAASIAWRL